MISKWKRLFKEKIKNEIQRRIFTTDGTKLDIISVQGKEGTFVEVHDIFDIIDAMN